MSNNGYSTFTFEEYKNAWKNEETIDDFFKLTKPYDYFFDIGEDHDVVFVSIVAKVFYDRNNCLDDQTPRIDHLTPKYLFEEMDSTWESEKSLKETKEELIKRGFVWRNLYNSEE